MHTLCKEDTLFYHCGCLKLLGENLEIVCSIVVTLVTLAYMSPECLHSLTFLCDVCLQGLKSKGVDLKKKLVQKIFHHRHHHHHHHLHRHHPHHHYHHHRHPHHYHHHDGKTKHHNHHHHSPHHHYHNPFKHHLHRYHHPYKKHVHRHPHKHPLHQHHRPHKQHIQKHHKDGGHRHSNKRSGIAHAPAGLPNKLQLHVQIKDSQATKRQSLPVLLANLGQHLVKLGSSLSPEKSHKAVQGK